MKQYQQELFSSEKKRNDGMVRSECHAEIKSPGWSDRAYRMLLLYIRKIQTPFMTEEVRHFAKQKGLEDPPSQRAWGSVIRRAVKNRVIISVGYGRTLNPNAHRTPANIWAVRK